MKKQKVSKNRKLNIGELKIIAYISTLILAGFLVYMQVESPAAWGFLGSAIGTLFGQFSSTSKQ